MLTLILAACQSAPSTLTDTTYLLDSSEASKLDARGIVSTRVYDPKGRMRSHRDLESLLDVEGRKQCRGPSYVAGTKYRRYVRSDYRGEPLPATLFVDYRCPVLSDIDIIKRSTGLHRIAKLEKDRRFFDVHVKRLSTALDEVDETFKAFLETEYYFISNEFSDDEGRGFFAKKMRGRNSLSIVPENRFQKLAVFIRAISSGESEIVFQHYVYWEAGATSFDDSIDAADYYGLYPADRYWSHRRANELMSRFEKYLAKRR
ncbi:hypothetical protein [Henriciella sp.]|uniref:hypothetical protein n=1 Tax=Henriciella sp. TaxID=1968823 RepID=UPI00260F89C7|nr:hypothetical protein [Henriciella sp.]